MPNKPVRKGRDSFSSDLLRHVDEAGSPDSIAGVEYFTVISTGQGGMSQSGLARLVGKSPSTISDLVNKVRNSDPVCNDLSEPLKSFAGKALNLVCYADPEGREILEDGFCAAVIQHYACWTRSTKENTQAKLALKLVAHFGLRTLIHRKTGWRIDRDLDPRILELQEENLELQKENQYQRTILEEVVAEMEGARSLNRVSHNATHNQSGHLNRPIQKIKSYLKPKRSSRKRSKKGDAS